MYKVPLIFVLGLSFRIVLSTDYLPTETLDGPRENLGYANYDPSEYGEYFEGDIILTQEQLKDLFSLQRNGLIHTKYRWQNKTVPYKMCSCHSNAQKYAIEQALNTIRSVSCIKFVKRTTEVDYVQIQGEARGCYGNFGRKGGEQILNLQSNMIGEGCFKRGVIMHEFLHALGFLHMHSSYDRDDYVTVHMGNVIEGFERNFNKQSSDEVSHFGARYDYDSVMHYSAYAFTKNGKPTIVPDEKYTEYMNRIGQRERLSETDILKINVMYECDER